MAAKGLIFSHYLQAMRESLRREQACNALLVSYPFTLGE
jgi:hypothetical protein